MRSNRKVALLHIALTHLAGAIIWNREDLNVLDYFVWGHIKNLIEHRRDGTEAEVREAILAAFDTITPEMALSATRNIIRRAELCLQERGRSNSNNSYIKSKSRLNLVGIPLKKSALCYLPQGSVETIAYFLFRETEREKAEEREREIKIKREFGANF